MKHVKLFESFDAKQDDWDVTKQGDKIVMKIKDPDGKTEETFELTTEQVVELNDAIDEHDIYDDESNIEGSFFNIENSQSSVNPIIYINFNMEGKAEVTLYLKENEYDAFSMELYNTIR
jgi:hypothetical protein